MIAIQERKKIEVTTEPTARAHLVQAIEIDRIMFFSSLKMNFSNESIVIQEKLKVRQTLLTLEEKILAQITCLSADITKLRQPSSAPLFFAKITNAANEKIRHD